MRRVLLPTDVWICLLLSMLIAQGTGYVAKQVAQKVYVKELENHAAVDGEIGGRADKTVFRAQSVEDLLSHDTFTIVSEGIHFMNDGMGYHGKFAFYSLELPSGERVAAVINRESVQFEDEVYHSGESVLPVGRIVWEDLSQDELFLGQIEYRDPLTRKDFYVDMVGDTAVMAEEQAVEAPQLFVQLLTVCIFFPIFHAIGSSLGIFPRYFALRHKKKEK